MRKKERKNTLNTAGRKKKFVWLLLLFCFFQLFAQVTAPKNEEEQKKQAEQWFEDEEFGKAYSLYSNLLANYPKDPKYNYRVGVCIIYVGDEKGDRKRAISYLETAKKSVSDLDKEVIFYLAKAYHLNYRFDDAIRTYNEYKNTASSGNIKKLKVDREIESARNGKRLLSKVKDLVVLEKKRLTVDNYFRSYDQSFYGGNLLVKTDQFKLSADKKKKDQFILFQSKNKEFVLFSSYGETGDKGKDIFMARKMGGTYAQPFPLPGFVNTEYDEDYPYLHPNGRDLFFCSKGHNSMGGYDIFKSTWDEEKQLWTKPVNLEFPINTPADDIQFVTDSVGKLAIFSSTRVSEYGKIDVYKVNLERRTTEFAQINGNVMQKDNNASKTARITVKDMESGENYGPFAADSKGSYSLKIPNGGKFIFTVETDGFPTQSESVTVPVAYDLRPYGQVVTYEDNKKLVIQNFFEPAEDEQAYEKMISVLEKTSKLDPNADQFKELTDTKSGSNNATNENNTSASVNTNTDSNAGTNTNTDVKKNITNKELLQIANKDLEEVVKESTDLKSQSDNATKLALSIKEEADRKTVEANEALTKVQSATDPGEKQRAQEDYNTKKNEADKLTDISAKAQNIANSLKVDADNKEKEKQLQEKFVKAMNEVNNSPNNQSKLTILSNIEKELRDHQEKTKDLKHDDIADNTQAEIDQVENTLISLATNRNGVKSELDQINADINEKNRELKETKDKDLADNLKTDIQNLEADKTEKEKELKLADDKVVRTQSDLDKLKSQNAVARTMLEQSKTGNTDLNPLVAAAKTNSGTNSSATDNNSNNSTSENSTNTDVQANVFAEKQNSYREKIAVINGGQETKESLKEKQTVLADYNKTIDEKINENKLAIKNSKDKDEKAKLTAENKELEKQKTDNNKMLAEAKKKEKAAPTNAELLASNNNSNNNGNSSAITDNNTNNTSTSTNSTSNNDNNATNTINNTTSTVTANNNSNENNANEESFAVRENVLKEKLSELDTAKAKEDYSVKINVLNEYNRSIDEQIKENKIAKKETKDKTEKQRLDEEIKSLEQKKKDNFTAIAVAKKEQQTAPTRSDLAANNSTGNNSKSTTENNTNTNSDNTNSNSVADNAVTNNTAVNTNTTTTNTNSGNTNTTTDNNQVVNDNNATNRMNPGVENTSTVNGLSNVEYTDRKANEQKQSALNKLQEIEKEKKQLANPVVAAIDPVKQQQFQEQQAAIDKTNAEAENLQSQARTIRTEANNKTGSEKENMIAQAKKLEEKALANRIDASTKQGQLNEEQINENNRIIAQIKNQNGGSNNSAEVQRMEDDVKSLEKKAEAMKAEGNNQTDVGQKLGAYANAEDVEKEAIAKQQQIIDLYKSNSTTNADQNQVKQKVEENNKEKSEALTQLTQANKTEYNSVQPLLTDAQKKSDNKKDPEAAAWKKESASLIKAADALIGKAKAEKDIEKRNEMLETALVKQDSALFLSNKAKMKYEGGDVVAYENSYTARKSSGSATDNNNTNSVATNNTSAVSHNSTGNNDNSTNNTANNNTSSTVNTNENNSATNSSIENNANNNTTANANTNAGNLTPQKIEEVKSSAEYKQYTGYVTKATKANNDADKDEQLSKRYMDEATANMKLSNDKRIEADKLPEGTQKEKLKKEAIVLEHKALDLKQKADSLNELASNTRAYGKEQETLANDYAGTLDQKKLDEIRSVSGVTNDNSSTDNSVVPAHTQAFNDNSKRYEEQLTNLGTDNEAALSNRIQVQKTYVADIENEILQVKNEIAATNNETEKTNLNNRLADLNRLRKEKKASLADDIARRDNLKNNPAVANTNTGSNPNTTNNSGTNTDNNTSPDNVGTNNNTSRVISTSGLKVSSGNAYSDANPIPIDKKWPDGIIYTVQVGAFKTPVPNSTFKGLSPVSATTAPNGFIRYQAGMFTEFSEANAAKNDMRKIGFKDAFVAVYKNGQRILLPELGNQANSTLAVSNTSLGINTNSNVPDGGAIVNNTTSTNANVAPVNATEINKMGGLFYTVQVGVYSESVSSKQLFNLQPVFMESLPSGKLRYTAGTYSSFEKVNADKTKVNQLGIGDAFVSAYFNGKRITVPEARQKQSEGSVQMSAENPIRFPGSADGSGNVNITPIIENNISNSNPVIENNSGNNTPVIENNQTNQPFFNGVTNDPVPTPENGVKLSSEGIVYKIQIGAFSKAVPSAVASNWMKIKTWPIRNYTNEKGLIIYTVGSFGDAGNAKKLLAEVSANGINDAFISVFKDGKRLSFAEAIKYLR